MSKQKLKKTFLCIQSNYSVIEGILSCGNTPQFFSLPKEQSSAQTIPTIDRLLLQQGITIQDLDAIIANQGPAPFTSLRTVIATVNGIAFATGIPLVSVNGLDAFLKEYTNQNITVALLNAFHNSVYFGIQEPNGTPEIGCKSIDQLLETLHKRFAQSTIHFIGNGTQMYREKIVEQFKNRAVIAEPLPMYCSIEQVLKIGIHHWENQENICAQIMPLYLKKPI